MSNGFKVKDKRHHAPNQPANRKERRKASVYRLVPLAIKRGHPDQLEQVDDTPHYIEGEVDDFVIVSVPESMNRDLCDKLHQRAMDTLGRPVVVVTHNIAFLKAVKLSASRGAELLRMVNDGETKTQPSGTSEEGVGGCDRTESAGGRSGVCSDGAGGSGEDSDWTGEDTRAEGGEDPEIAEEGTEGDESLGG